MFRAARCSGAGYAVIRAVGARGAQYNSSCLKNKALALGERKMGEISRGGRADDESTADAKGGGGAQDPAPQRTAVRHEPVTSEEAGSRLDKVLGRLLPGVPRTRLFRLLRKGEVRLNGKRTTGEVR